MKKKLSFFCAVFLSSLMAKNSLAIDDLRIVKNQSIINLIKKKIEDSKEKAATVDREIMFMVNLGKINEIIVSFVYLASNTYNHFLVKKMVALIKVDKCLELDKMIEFITSENSNLNFDPKILKLKFLGTNDISSVYTKLFYIKNDLGLKNYIDFEKGGRIYYTVPSEDKLDDVHMVYESGNEKKEFKFTNSPEMPIVPVEEANKINQENIKPKKNFFSLPNFISKFFKKNYQEKNNNDFLNEEQKKLKVD
jgi:hypothetical protein